MKALHIQGCVRAGGGDSRTLDLLFAMFGCSAAAPSGGRAGVLCFFAQNRPPILPPLGDLRLLDQKQAEHERNQHHSSDYLR
jgi:hypothetical protein